MRYWLATLAGYVLAGAAIIAGAWAILHLARTGTCASGGPYVSARPCPKGAGDWISALIGGVFAIIFAGGLLGARGSGPFRPSSSAFAGVWTVGWGVLAYSLYYSATGPANPNPHHEHIGSYVTAGLFAALALAGLVWFARSLASSDTGPSTSMSSGSNSRRIVPVASTMMPPGPGRMPLPNLQPRPGGPVPMATALAGTARASGTSEDDQLTRLQRLGELHANGTLTDAEFAAQKQKILGG